MTLVRLANFSDRPIRLRADLLFAEYHPVSRGVGRVVPMEPDPDSAGATGPSCSVIDRPGLKGEQPKKDEKRRSELQSNLKGTTTKPSSFCLWNGDGI